MRSGVVGLADSEHPVKIKCQLSREKGQELAITGSSSAVNTKSHAFLAARRSAMRLRAAQQASELQLKLKLTEVEVGTVAPGPGRSYRSASKRGGRARQRSSSARMAGRGKVVVIPSRIRAVLA